MGEVSGQMPEHVTKEFVDSSMDVDKTPQFKKVVNTPAIRMAGSFTVTTREGTLTCEDGWLAIDAGGWPYPIDDAEFRRIYEPVNDKDRAYFEAMP